MASNPGNFILPFDPSMGDWAFDPLEWNADAAIAGTIDQLLEGAFDGLSDVSGGGNNHSDAQEVAPSTAIRTDSLFGTKGPVTAKFDSIEHMPTKDMSPATAEHIAPADASGVTPPDVVRLRQKLQSAFAIHLRECTDQVVFPATTCLCGHKACFTQSSHRQPPSLL
jgi:hypothetical protein